VVLATLSPPLKLLRVPTSSTEIRGYMNSLNNKSLTVPMAIAQSKKVTDNVIKVAMVDSSRTLLPTLQSMVLLLIRITHTFLDQLIKELHHALTKAAKSLLKISPSPMSL